MAAVNRNRVAMATLTMAMTTNKTMGALNEAKDTSWPAGVAWKVIKKLKEKNQPMDMMTAVELEAPIECCNDEEELDDSRQTTVAQLPRCVWWLVNEKAYRLSFCEDPFLCAIISSDSNDSVDTCRHKIRMLFQPTYVRFPL